jgi:ComF family protein
VDDERLSRVHVKIFLEQCGVELRGAVAPERCMGCLREGEWLCPTCRVKVPPVENRCVMCRKIAEVKNRQGLCASCSQVSGLAGIIGAGPYGTPLLRRGVHWLKFKGVTAVTEHLALLILPKLLTIAPLKELVKSAVMIPIPLHIRKYRKRGFNQSEALTRELARWTGIAVNMNLVRSRGTWSQSKLPHDLRARNVAEAFKWEGKIEDGVKYILLVDDVATSGSTLTAAAKALAGSDKQVWGVVVARR